MSSPCFVGALPLPGAPAAPPSAPCVLRGPVRARMSGAVRRQRARAPARAAPAAPGLAPPDLAPGRDPAGAPEAPPPPPAERFAVRDAAKGELYTVADVRCGAFYEHPTDPYFYPMRRREIYTALSERVGGGTRCLVAVDHAPPPDWRPFCGRGGALVVASLDLTLHHAASGRRVAFADAGAGPPGDARLYVSSMAVRADWRRRGLARRLLRAVEDEARAAGVREVFLHVDEFNEPAVRLYTREGFVPAAERRRRPPEWLAFLAKREHTLLRKRIAPEE